MDQNKELDNLRHDIEELWRDVSAISSSIAQLVNVWKDFIEVHGTEHSDLVDSLQEIANGMRSLLARDQEHDNPR